MDCSMIYSVYGGTGFVGGNFCNTFPDNIIKQGREERIPNTKNLLYFISTTHNYNVHSNITLDIETNLKTFCEVLDHCRSSEYTINYISSWFVYGDGPLPARESDRCKPTGFYSITKKAAEDLLISFCKTYGVSYRILRLCNVLGRGDGKASAQKNALTYMIDLLKNNEDVYLYDGGTAYRDVMHVNDVCKAIELVCRKGNLNEIYNIGSGQPTRVSDIISKAKEYLGSTSNILSKPTPEFHKIVQTESFWMDTSKLKGLGFSQEISNDLIIQELCQ